MLNDLPQYRQSLEARYPIVCAECSPKISATIRDQDYRLKAALLHNSAKRLAGVSSPKIKSAPRFQPNTCSLSTPTNPCEVVLKGMGSPLWLLQEWIWRARGLLWMLSHLLGVLVNLFCWSICLLFYTLFNNR